MSRQEKDFYHSQFVTCYFDNYPGCGQDAGPCDKMIFWQKAITDYWALISHPLSPDSVSHDLESLAVPTCRLIVVIVNMMLLAILMVTASAPGLSAAEEESECDR